MGELEERRARGWRSDTRPGETRGEAGTSRGGSAGSEGPSAPQAGEDAWVGTQASEKGERQAAVQEGELGWQELAGGCSRTPRVGVHPSQAGEPTGIRLAWGGGGVWRPAWEGEAPAIPLPLPPQLPTSPHAPGPLTSCPLHILTWRERWGGMKELVWNRLLYSAPRQGAGSTQPSSPPCPPPLAAPRACSKLSFPPPTANVWIEQDKGAELSLCPTPFPTSSPQIQTGRLRGSPALTVCHPAGPAASRPLAAPSGGPRPGPRGRSPRTDSPGPWCVLFCGG